MSTTDGARALNSGQWTRLQHTLHRNDGELIAFRAGDSVYITEIHEDKRIRRRHSIGGTAYYIALPRQIPATRWIEDRAMTNTSFFIPHRLLEPLDPTIPRNLTYPDYTKCRVLGPHTWTAKTVPQRLKVGEIVCTDRRAYYSSGGVVPQHDVHRATYKVWRQAGNDITIPYMVERVYKAAAENFTNEVLPPPADLPPLRDLRTVFSDSIPKHVDIIHDTRSGEEKLVERF